MRRGQPVARPRSSQDRGSPGGAANPGRSSALDRRAEGGRVEQVLAVGAAHNGSKVIQEAPNAASHRRVDFAPAGWKWMSVGRNEKTKDGLAETAAFGRKPGRPRDPGLSPFGKRPHR